MRIEGKINVPLGFDPEGIAVYNKNSKKGTISSEEGNFQLFVQKGDIIVFSALQFEELELKIDQEIINSGYLQVQIFGNINELPEIVVNSHHLTGNLSEDIKNIELVEINLPDMSSAEINEYEWNFQADAQTSPINAAMGQSRGASIAPGANPLALLGILINPILPDFDAKTKKEKIKERSKREKILLERKVRSLLDNSFFEYYLNIPTTEISSFLTFCEENNFDQDLLQEEKKLDLIQFLVLQSKEFKTSKSGM